MYHSDLRFEDMRHDTSDLKPVFVNPEPWTPKLDTLMSPNPQILDLEPESRKPRPGTRNARPETRNPDSETRNPIAGFQSANRPIDTVDLWAVRPLPVLRERGASRGFKFFCLKARTRLWPYCIENRSTADTCKTLFPADTRKPLIDTVDLWAVSPLNLQP
jgi:hypothetical protein